MAEQDSLFDMTPIWEETWKGMPEYENEDMAPVRQLKVNFRSDSDRKAFAKRIGQTITPLTRSIWYPEAEITRMVDKVWVTRQEYIPRYPVYIISKGRHESRLTVKTLEEIGTPYRIVIEPQEYDQYSSVIDPQKILVLPFSNLGQGSIPARNWVWEHSIAEGHKRHWILDDNIKGVFRYHENVKRPLFSSVLFTIAENYADRYTNLVLCGFDYFMFVKRKFPQAPVQLNTRVYSCLLIQNDIDFRWRGRYNEDTDLSIRVMKAGYCTALFRQFMIGKQQTMTMKGGNTDELYRGDGRLVMAESLREQHPDIVQVVWKFNRWQHHVDYRPFKNNKPRLKPGVILSDAEIDYGFELVGRDEH